MSRIVVGHDGSGHSEAAVREALELGRAFQLPVVVVRAFTPEETGYAKGIFPPPTDLEEDQQRAELSADLIRFALEYPEVKIQPLAKPGQPAPVLVEQSKGARMVVVGSRGLGGFSKLMGSVSDRVVAQAKTTVVIVREGAGD